MEIKIAITSGYFDPIHIGHIKYLKAAKKFANYLVVIVNNDQQAKLKKGQSFMSFEERCSIIKELKCVDRVIESIDEDRTVSKTLKFVVDLIKKENPSKEVEFIFANGGDYNTNKKCPEEDTCNDLGIKSIYGVGGEKIQSSSDLIKKAKNGI